VDTVDIDVVVVKEPGERINEEDNVRNVQVAVSTPSSTSSTSKAFFFFYNTR